MQYVRNLSDSVSTAWNSLNPATLSGAIDVIVVEQEDGTMSCSPFHVRFGKFQLLRPSDKKVEFKVNGEKQNYAMKLGEGGEAFFVFETKETIPQDLQTSPLASPASSPSLSPETSSLPGLQEPELLELDAFAARARRPPPAVIYSTSAPREEGMLSSLSAGPGAALDRPQSVDWSVQGMRPYSDDILRRSARTSEREHSDDALDGDSPRLSDRSNSPPPLPTKEAVERAIALSKELSAVNIPSHVTETGDLMLDMTGFKSKNDEAFRAEIMARKILSEELDGNYDIGALFGMDEQGNLWIYSSEDAKEAAMKRTVEAALRSSPLAADAVSDPGYQSDGSDVTTTEKPPTHRRTESDLGTMALTPPSTPPDSATAGDPNLNYAKTLRLTSDQLKELKLKPGQNSMSFSVGRSTCQAYMYLWRHDAPVIISDIDGTITKSDALGHIMNMVGRDWTHIGVAKLYSDIAANGYNIMYLTSRSVGQADTTRAYLNGIQQDGYRLPRGPTILSPDRTMAALRREIYLRKPHVFKMATLRDIRNLYGQERKPFIAGFGNRFSDQISYRTVDVPGNRIFTINSNAEVVLDVLSLNKRTMSYRNINEIVDHYFPPVATLVREGREDFTDFMYWRERPLELDDFTDSDSDADDDDEQDEEQASQYAEDDDEAGEGMADSYISHASVDEESVMSDSMHQDQMMSSMIEDQEDADDEDEEEELDDQAELTQVIEATAKRSVPALSKESSVEEDVNAELITGVKHLSVEKDVKDQAK